MNKLMLSIGFAVVTALGMPAADDVSRERLPLRITDETAEAKAERLAWWQEGRFGMFIHFGLYAMAARHEQVKWREAISDESYDGKYFSRFDPDLFDARTWVRAAKDAGMKYIVLTAKHHEGFCLWDTKTTDYKITNTPFGRDLVREYVEACRSEGVRVGLYFSLMDWHSPDYAVDYRHPEFAALQRRGLSGKELAEEVARLNRPRDMERFRAMMFDQVRELLTDYGRIDLIWYDFTPKAKQYGKTYRDWNAVELVKFTRRLQPKIIMDNRLDLLETDDGWDFVTPEQFKVQVVPTIRGKKVPWETCQTFSGSWGYHRDEETWKSTSQLLGLLIHSVSMGGNLILNVGPTARGEFDGRAQDRLADLAKWMRANARSIYGCGPAPKEFAAPTGTELTYNPKSGRLYIHVYDYPVRTLPVAFWKKIAYAQFLHDGSELDVRDPIKWDDQDGEQLGQCGWLTFPVRKPNVEVPVVEVFLKSGKGN